MRHFARRKQRNHDLRSANSSVGLAGTQTARIGRKRWRRAIRLAASQRRRRRARLGPRCRQFSVVAQHRIVRAVESFDLAAARDFRFYAQRRNRSARRRSGCGSSGSQTKTHTTPGAQTDAATNAQARDFAGTCSRFTARAAGCGARTESIHNVAAFGAARGSSLCARTRGNSAVHHSPGINGCAKAIATERALNLETEKPVDFRRRAFLLFLCDFSAR